jgi:hypothetical protein
MMLGNLAVARLLAVFCQRFVCEAMFGIDPQDAQQPAQALFVLAVAQQDPPNFLAQGRVTR